MGEAIRAHAEAVVLLGLIVVALLVACVFVAISARRVFSKKTDRGKRARIEAKRFVAWVISATIIVIALNYAMDVKTRSGAHEWQQSISTEDGGLYTAEYCYVGFDKILLRLYSSQDRSLLAERMYWYPDSARLLWTSDSLVFNTNPGSGSGEIQLPPTLLDRLLAKLP